MKTTILKNNLTKGLNIVEKITGRNLTLPILNNVLINTQDNALKLSTTDLELGISYWVLAQIQEKGTITVPVRPFSNFVSLVEEQKLTLEIKEKTLLIKGENYKSQIKGLEAKDFPIIPEVSSEIFIELNALEFCQAIMQVIDFCALTQIRPELSGIHFFFQKNEVKIVATDSFRLAEKTLFLEGLSENLTSAQSFILPKNASRELINIFSENDQKIKLYFSPSQIMVQSFFDETKNPQARLVSRLIEGEYPNYQEVIPKEFKTQIILSKDRFLNQIKTASLFSGRANEVRLKVNPQKGQVEIFSQNVDLGESKSRLSAKIKGQETDVCFNYKFLAEGLAQIKTSEVVFEINGQEGPGVLRPLDEATFLYVIMPIKSH